MDISQSKAQFDYTAAGTYSVGNIKGFWCETSTNSIVYDDAEGNEHTITDLPAFLVPPIAGKITIKSGTNVDLLIFL